MRFQVRPSAITAAVTGLILLSAHAGAEPSKGRRSKPPSRPVVISKFDPTAERVELFAGMKDGDLETKVVAMNPQHGYVLISNTTDAPLTVELPAAFVAVPTAVLKQFGGGGGGGQFGGGGGGFGGQQGGGGGGGQQQQGGGFGGQQGGGGGGFGGQQGGGGGGQGFFSIPPEKTVKVNYVGACLNHGKADPNPRVSYSMISLDDYTTDPILKELIVIVGTGRVAPPAVQAAIWNRTDDMSIRDLAAKFSYNSIGVKVPYFSRNDLTGAQQIMATAVGRVRERGENPVAETEAKPARAGVR